MPFPRDEYDENAIRDYSSVGYGLNQSPVEPIRPTGLTGNSFSKVIPIWKFVLLAFITFGIYELYWFYKNWKFFKEYNNIDIYPFWRAFFGYFFVYSLLERILNLTKEEGYTKTFSSIGLAIFWIVMIFLSWLPDPYWLISFFSVLALIPPLQAMNYYWDKTQPDLPEKPFAWWQTILIGVGVLLWVLVLIGLFIPA